jgi:hypothetical protein
MESTLKKTVVVAGQKITLHSLDGSCWSSDLVQLQKRIQEREKEQAKILAEAAKFFKNRVGM